MKENFERALEFTLTWEGGFVDNPTDPGGVTKYGISQKAYPDLDIRNLTIEQAKEIYKRDYWDRAACDNYLTPMDIIMFDTAVNMGVNRAGMLLGQSQTWQDFIMNRVARYTYMSKPQFLKGWINRAYALYKFCKKIDQMQPEYQVGNTKVFDVT